ncbi:MAG: phosphate acyltransferase PlsX [Planctomycetes bacterium]|nr:phosphate acyltransferase PlsX [Planctomycetota bacterium]
MRIALDAMGGDHAPESAVHGALRAVDKGFVEAGQVVLVGQLEPIEALLRDAGASFCTASVQDFAADTANSASDAFVIVPATEVVGMHETPTVALRQKKDSSLLVATRLVKHGHCDALCSAGNTGACVAAAMLSLKGLDGVHRPGIAVTIEGDRGPFTIVDVGANVNPKPVHLLQYGLMGACLYRKQFDKERPSVGLVNIGGEEGKGNDLAKETQERFRSSGLNYIGNVEGQDVFLGAADVLVTEGFVGNVILKLSEGLATHLLHVVQEELVRSGVNPDRIKTSLERIWKRCDYSEYGGALLLGVEGIVTICHGRSDATAISNAIRVSRDAVRSEVTQSIVEVIRESQSAKVDS